MAGKRSSKLETDKRIFTIQGWIIKGVPDYLILKNIENQFKNSQGVSLSRVQSKLLIRKAYKIWHDEQEADIEQQRAMTIAGLQQDIRGMKDEYKGTPQGMSVVNSIKKEISKLKALYPARVTVIQGDKENPLVITDGFTQEKENELKTLLKKAIDLGIM